MRLSTAVLLAAFILLQLLFSRQPIGFHCVLQGHAPSARKFDTRVTKRDSNSVMFSKAMLYGASRAEITRVIISG